MYVATYICVRVILAIKCASKMIMYIYRDFYLYIEIKVEHNIEFHNNTIYVAITAAASYIQVHFIGTYD